MNSSKVSHDNLAEKLGKTIRNGTLFRIENEQHKYIESNEVLIGKTVLIFMGPAPFSRLDTEQAIAYEKLSKQLLQYVDDIYGIYCQDAFVMQQFEKHVQTVAGSKNVKFYGDGDGMFARYNELLHDYTNSGLGQRSGRWAFVANSRIIEFVSCDDFSELDVTSAANLLEVLKDEA
jgi:peroxiredoxin